MNRLYRFFKILFKTTRRARKVDNSVKVQDSVSLLHPLYFNSGSFSEQKKGNSLRIDWNTSK
jgi:hypothetical protein